MTSSAPADPTSSSTPDYFLFHVGRPLGDHGQLDVWPRRKELVVREEPEAILEAIDDRGITRLVVEDRPTGEPAFEREALASARARVATCLAYSASGRVADGDVRIASNPVTEGDVETILDPEAHLARLRAESGGDDGYADAVAARAGEVDPERSRARAHRALAEVRSRARAHRALAELRRQIKLARRTLIEDGIPVETYRRIGLDDALARLG